MCICSCIYLGLCLCYGDVLVLCYFYGSSYRESILKENVVVSFDYFVFQIILIEFVVCFKFIYVFGGW